MNNVNIMIKIAPIQDYNINLMQNEGPLQVVKISLEKFLLRQITINKKRKNKHTNCVIEYNS